MEVRWGRGERLQIGDRAVNHGFASDPADAARLALSAGVDMEMVSTAYVTNGAGLVREGRLAGRPSTRP